MLKQIFIGFLGAIISLVCLVPPIIHFVTGPLGPFIGGFIGGLICSYSKNAKYIIGITLGFTLAAIVNLIGFILNYLKWSFLEHFNQTQLPQIFKPTTVLMLSIVIFIYSSVLGIIGVYIAERIKHRNQQTDFKEH